MITVSKNVYINKLDDIVNQYNNTYHRTIKMKSFDVTCSTYINIGVENNDKDRVRISKYKNVFAKGYVSNWSAEVFVIKKVKNTVLWTHIISDLNVGKIAGTFYENELQKTNQTEFRIKN